MNEKALFNLTYGLFLVSTKAEGKLNGCIVNTVTQVASSPTRLAVCCINGNLTPELIKKSGAFTVTVLDKRVPFSFFEDFGLRHGFDVAKFEGYEVHYDDHDMPYIENYANAVFSLKVVETIDLGSHTMFIGEVTNCEVLSKEKPVTYSEYHSDIKPKKTTSADKKATAWKCTICGYIYDGEKLPEDYTCPLCGHPASDFEPIYG